MKHALDIKLETPNTMPRLSHSLVLVPISRGAILKIPRLRDLSLTHTFLEGLAAIIDMASDPPETKAEGDSAQTIRMAQGISRGVGERIDLAGDDAADIADREGDTNRSRAFAVRGGIRRKPGEIATTEHPGTGGDKEAGEVIDADGETVSGKKDSVAYHPYRGAEDAGEEAASEAVGEVAGNTINDRAPEEDGDAEVLGLFDGEVEAEAEDDGEMECWLEDGFPINVHQENLEEDQKSLDRLLDKLKKSRS